MKFAVYISFIFLFGCSTTATDFVTSTADSSTYAATSEFQMQLNRVIRESIDDAFDRVEGDSY